ncbi:MAG: RAMP superfamily CRISPR-associated protein [Stenomitos frigidus ULC029]
MEVDRSVDFIPFPTEAPSRNPLVGHDRLHADRYHGSLALELTALTPIFIAAGITAMGSDVGVAIPLIRVMGQDSNGNPILQGTSLKGCLRAVYETITNSSVGVEGTKPSGNHKPNKVEGKWLEERRTSKLSPAELVFGALGFQGLISIADAVGDRPLEMGYLPPMFQPRSGNGRKFYRHETPHPSASNSVNHAPGKRPAEPDKPPSPIQQAPIDTLFFTTLRFSNLTLAQVGALCVALGLNPDDPNDPNYSFALKLGAGKGKGLGGVKVRLVKHSIIKGDSLTQARYLDYHPTPQRPPSKSVLTDAVKAAHATLIHKRQLEQLRDILRQPGANA